LSNVSFADCDITRIRFGKDISWGGEDGFTIVEEVWLKEHGKKADKNENERSERVAPGLELVLSVYRNLRENYEFRLSYDDAGKFFIKEMELKRKYRDGHPTSAFRLKLIALAKKLKRDNDSSLPEVQYGLKEKGRFERNFSLTGLYYHLSRYGESISRPAAVGVITVFLSTLFWLIQTNPTSEPSLSNVAGFAHAGNMTHWLKSFERSFADFLPLLSLGSDTKVGIIDYIIKIVGGALTFGLLAIALRRKFERKYTR
jgi:hypothetical protein